MTSIGTYDSIQLVTPIQFNQLVYSGKKWFIQYKREKENIRGKKKWNFFQMICFTTNWFNPMYRDWRGSNPTPHSIFVQME